MNSYCMYFQLNKNIIIIAISITSYRLTDPLFALKKTRLSGNAK